MEPDAESQSSKITAANHKFTCNLYQVLAKDENTFFSPFSIQIALILAFLGAKGKTADELALHLHLPEKREDLLHGIRKLLDGLKNPQLNTATEMFVEQTYKLKASYKEEAKIYLNSQSQGLDFKNAAERATQIINTWVSSQTNKKIENLIPPGVCNEDTRLVLINAIHFKDKWLNEFKEANTFDQPFYNTKETPVHVKMMHITDRFNYLEKESFKVLELPYKDRDFRMVILLPKEIDGLPALEQQLPTLNLLSILNEWNRVKVNVSLPKFKLENFIDLNDALEMVGIKTMFDENAADFSGIHEPTERPLVVSKVLHKAFVEVSEEGTEAAAATGVILMARCALMEFPEQIFDFIADHPFIFYIYHRNIVLFCGKLVSVQN